MPEKCETNLLARYVQMGWYSEVDKEHKPTGIKFMDNPVVTKQIKAGWKLLAFSKYNILLLTSRLDTQKPCHDDGLGTDQVEVIITKLTW